MSSKEESKEQQASGKEQQQIAGTAADASPAATIVPATPPLPPTTTATTTTTTKPATVQQDRTTAANGMDHTSMTMDDPPPAVSPSTSTSTSSTTSTIGKKGTAATEKKNGALSRNTATKQDPADATKETPTKSITTTSASSKMKEEDQQEEKQGEKKEKEKKEETKKPLSKLELMRMKRLKAREDKKRALEKEREARERAASKPTTVASRKAAQKKAAAIRAAKQAEKILKESRKDISDELLFVRFSGYVWTCSRRGSSEFGKWHRRYMELHYREVRFLVKRGGTSAIPKSYPILKGTKIKSMKKVTNLPGHEEESFPSFEILIGGTSLRHWCAVPTVASLESWMHAMREFVPSVMSILRSTRMPSKSDRELEDQREHERREDAKHEELKKKIKEIFKIAKPNHSGVLLKKEFIEGMEMVKKNPATNKKITRDPVLKILLKPRLWLQSMMDLETTKENYVSFDEVLHFVRLIETRDDKRRTALEKLFNLIDRDSNGELDSSEIVDAVSDNPDVRIMMKDEEALLPLLNPATYEGAFAAMDLNHDGVVTIEEMMIFCDHYEERASTRMHNLRLFFKLVDIDNDGTLTKEEVLEAMTSNPEVRILVEEEPSLVPLLSPAHYRDAFAMMDTDGDGTISLQELFEFCGVREDKMASSLHEWRTLFDLAVTCETERTSGKRTGEESTITLRMLSLAIMTYKEAARAAQKSSIVRNLLKPSTFHRGATQFNHYAREYHHVLEVSPDEGGKEGESRAAFLVRGIVIGVRVKTKEGELGVVRFVDLPQGFESEDVWCGIELDRPHGTGDGMFQSQGESARCFVCLPNHGIFVRDPLSLHVVDDVEGKALDAVFEKPPSLPLSGFIDFCEEVCAHEEDGVHHHFVNGVETFPETKGGDGEDGEEEDNGDENNKSNQKKKRKKKKKKKAPEWHKHVHKNKWSGKNKSTMKHMLELRDQSSVLHKRYLFDKKKEERLLLAKERRRREALYSIEKAKMDAEKGAEDLKNAEALMSKEEKARAKAIRDREEELQKLLHKAHDHMLLRVPAVKGNELYCVECRRIQHEYKKKVSEIEEDDRRKVFDDRFSKAAENKKIDDEKWEADEEERRRQEDRRHGRFKECCKRDLKRFEIRKRMARKKKSEEQIIREIKKGEPNLFTGKKKKKKKTEAEGKEGKEGKEEKEGKEGKIEKEKEENKTIAATTTATTTTIKPSTASEERKRKKEEERLARPVDWWVRREEDDYGVSDADQGGGGGTKKSKKNHQQLLTWEEMEVRIQKRIQQDRDRFNIEWDATKLDRTKRFQEEKINSVARQREQEVATAQEEIIRKTFDDETERVRQMERDIRPSENKVLRREQANRQIYISTVGQMRTRSRMGRLLWQKTLRADGQTHTHQVYDAARQKSYIIKFIPCANESEVATIMDDVYLIKRVASDCPFLVDVDDCFYHSVTGLSGGYFIVVCIFECCVGGEARQAIINAEHGSRPMIHDGELLLWTTQTASAVGALHDHQFVHRNLKPENIFLTTNDEKAGIKVGDYPVTKTFEATLPEASTYVGAPRYLAPELLQQDFFPGVIAPPLDIWSLGCCVYYLASGKEICLREDGSFPKPLEEMLLAIPARFGTPLKDIIRQCLCLHPEERPSARQVARIADEELVAQENERQARHRNSKAIIDLFELIDEDQSGEIELDELLKATTSDRRVIRLLKKSERLRALLQPEKVRPFFEKMDANGDGVLTLDEMLNFGQRLHHEPTYEKELLNQVVQLFNLVDRTHKLYISKEEILECVQFRPDVVAIMEQHHKLALLLRPNTFEATFLELDTTHNGHVTLDELMEFVVQNHEQEEEREREKELERAKARAWRQVDRERRKR